MTANSTLVTDYFGEGTHAARPASPNVPSGCLAFYYETDTTNLFCWTGAAWKQITGAISSGPSIVQNAAQANNTSGSITLGAAPTQNNVLIAFVDNAVGMTAASGWAFVPIQGSGITGGTTQNNLTDFAAILWKIAGASESATQTPITQTGAGAIMMYEISSGAPSMGLIPFATAASGTLTLQALKSGGIALGALFNQSSTALPTTTPGTADSTANTASRSVAGFHASPTQGSNAYNWVYGASHQIYAAGVVMF